MGTRLCGVGFRLREAGRGLYLSYFLWETYFKSLKKIFCAGGHLSALKVIYLPLLHWHEVVPGPPGRTAGEMKLLRLEQMGPPLMNTGNLNPQEHIFQTVEICGL